MGRLELLMQQGGTCLIRPPAVKHLALAFLWSVLRGLSQCPLWWKV